MENPSRPNQPKSYRRSIFFPLLLVVVGLLFLLNNFGYIRGDLWEVIRIYWPVILIVIGLDSLFKREGLVGPLFWFGLGSLIIFYNLGYIQIDIWQALLILWPVMFIALGVDMIFGRRSLVWSMVGIGVIILLLVGAFLLFNSRTQTLTSGLAESVFELADVNELEVNISSSMGSVIVEAAHQVEGDTKLVITSAGITEQVKDQKGAHVEITITDDGSMDFPGKLANEWQWVINIPTNIRSMLNIDLGLGTTYLDLENTLITDLTAEFGVGSTELDVPYDNQFSGKLDGGMGLIFVNIPQNLPMKVSSDSALVLFDVPANYRKTETGYVSSNYRSDNDYAELFLNLGIGSVVIRDTTAR